MAREEEVVSGWGRHSKMCVLGTPTVWGVMKTSGDRRGETGRDWVVEAL